MSDPKKSVLALLALAGAVVVSGLASVATAQDAPPGANREARMAELFAEIDANGDGKVTLEELAAHRAALFATADTNGDGSLDADELAARELARFTESLPERTARMIERQDDNGDGRLQAAEIGQGPMEDHFARIDTDDDGAVSKAEAEAAAERLAGHRGKRKHAMRGGWFN